MQYYYHYSNYYDKINGNIAILRTRFRRILKSIYIFNAIDNI